MYDLKSFLASERIIVENVTCNPLLLHSAGQVIDFRGGGGEKLTVQILLGKNGEKPLLTAVKSHTVRLWWCLGRFSETWFIERQLIFLLPVTEIQVPPALGMC